MAIYYTIIHIYCGRITSVEYMHRGRERGRVWGISEDGKIVHW